MKNYTLLFAGIILLILGTTTAYYTHIHTFQNKLHTNTAQINHTQETISPSTSLPKHTQFLLYFDFACPHCIDFFTNTYLPLKKEYTKRNVDFNILPYSQRTVGKSFLLAKYLTCINTVSPRKTDQFIQTIHITDSIQDNATLLQKIQPITLSKTETKEFLSCTKNKAQSVEKQTLEIRTKAREKGVIGTPTFFINNTKFERNQSYKKVAIELEKILHTN